MPESYSYRLMREDEIATVDALAREIFTDDEMLDGTINKALCDAFSSANWKPRYWLAVHDGQIVGYAGWNWSWINYDICEFVWCGVLKEHRGRGVGRRLVEVRIDDIFEEDPAIRMILVNTGSPHIYRRYGFETFGVYDWRSGNNNHVMRLLLPLRE